jgi:hypothetical protein
MLFGGLQRPALAQLILLAAIGSAAAKDLCPAMSGQMQNLDSLYAAKSDCPDSTCLDALVPGVDGTYYLSHGPGDWRKLEKKATYNFFYRTKQTPVSNSVVTVQTKFFPSDPRTPEERKRISDVSLSRDQIKFACNPSANVSVKKVVSFDHYDGYHRAPGAPFSDDYKFLDEEYHVRYQPDYKRTCASKGVTWTKNWGRRQFFLLNARKDFQTNVLSVAARAVFTPAYADDVETGQMPDLSQIRVHMTSYTKEPGSSGCYSFPVQTFGAVKEVDVVLRDLDELQLSDYSAYHTSGKYTPDVWRMNVSE